MKKITFDEEELFAIAVFEPDTRVNTIKRLERVLPELEDDPEISGSAAADGAGQPSFQDDGRGAQSDPPAYDRKRETVLAGF